MFYLIIFILGACVGSFLNCLIYRLSTKKSFLAGRSFCPNCGHKLGFFDLIPILNFILLKGKCRYCGQNISFQYPLVEIATGILFLLIFNFQNFITTLYLLTISCLLIIIFVYDLKHSIIPDKIVYPAIGIAFLYRLILNSQFSIFNEFPIFNFQKINFFTSLLSAIVASGFFFFLWLVSRGRWMGLGDAKFAFFMGLSLGYPQILVAMFSAFLIGAIIGLGLIVSHKKTLKSQVPFGPFLVTGTFIGLFWGREIINWYLNLII